MIHIERRIPGPEVLDRRGRKERDEAAEFFSSKVGQAGHKRFLFIAHRDPQVRTALGGLFHGKCAFCETSLSRDQVPLQVAHFRPSQNCVGQDGRHFPRHYWWLSAEWTNLYPACGDCLAAKRNRFPIAGERAPLEARPAELDAEHPLLIDPCRDNPEEHLVYSDDAVVTSDTEPGRVSIELFDLNRRALLEMRRDQLRRLRAELEQIDSRPTRSPRRGTTRSGSSMRDAEARIFPFTRREAEYAGMCRQFARRFFDSTDPGTDTPEPHHDFSPKVDRAVRGVRLRKRPRSRTGASKKGLGVTEMSELMELSGLPEEPEESEDREHEHPEHVVVTRGAALSLGIDTDGELSEWGDFEATIKSTRYVSKMAQTVTTRAFDEYEQGLESFSLEAGEAEGASGYYLKSRTIERIVLHNFRAIGDLTLEPPRREGSWTMLLGENGCGKSSVLQAVALALMGETYRSRLGLDASDFVRRGREEGFVKVKLSGLRTEIVLRMRASSPRFDGEEAAKVLLLAYGATRLLPREPAESRGTRYARVDNLFNPFVPLEDARRWLLNLEPETFQRLKPALKELLNLGEHDDLAQNPAAGRLDVTLFDTTVPLEQLSDGYQTVIALVAEIMSILLDRWSDMAAAEGIVLVDEIGAHLHPKWKMRIVDSLRTTFPAVQFLVTSHDPLCLRGLEDDEIVVVRRNVNSEVVRVEDLPPVKALRVDQLLTSEHFGLASVHDSESARQLDEYYALLAKKRLTGPDEQRLRDLRGRLGELSLMGQTRRERLMLTAIDRYLAKEAETVGSSRASGRKQALDLKLDQILSST